MVSERRLRRSKLDVDKLPDAHDLSHWRQRLQSRLLSICWWVGLAIGLPSIVLSAIERVWLLTGAGTVALLWLGYLYLQRRSSCQRWTIQLLLVLYGVGITILVTLGYVAQIYFMALPVLAVLLWSNRAAVYLVGINVITLLCLGHFFKIDAGVLIMTEYPHWRLFLITMNFLFVNTIVTWACAVSFDEARRLLKKQADSAQALAHMVMHDPLTELANRRMLQQAIGQEIARSKRKGLPFAVVLMDLDHFKDINDTHGHDCGDELLKAVADRLRNSVREGDTVARLGGDEFVMLYQCYNRDYELQGMIERLMGNVCGQYILSGHDFTVDISLGVAVSPRDGEDPQILLKHADIAMYRAKAAGRSCYRLFSITDNAFADEPRSDVPTNPAP